MDKIIRKYQNFDEMKADEYRYWQSRPVHERIAACVLEPELNKAKKWKGFELRAFQITQNSCPF